MVANEELLSEYAVSDDQIRTFEKYGHILLRGLASHDLIQRFRPLILEEVRRRTTETRPLSERDTYGKAFLQIENLWVTNDHVRPFVMALRFAKVAAELLGVSGVRIYHDQALFKEPGGGYTPWHQDQIYWPVDAPHAVVMWMPLVDIPAEVGSMTFASGSHHRGFISKLQISDESHGTLKDYIMRAGLPTQNYGAMCAGDATFHSGWTLHSAQNNPDSETREVMTIIYVPDGTRVIEADSNARRSDLKRWIPDRSPGDLVDTWLNPLVYSKDA